MELTVTFPGADAPFEGDLALELGALPAGARVTASTLTLRPVAGPGEMPFTERLSFTNGTGDRGAIKAASSNGESFFIEIDFHTRRTLVSVTGTGLSDGNLQADVGGLFVPVGKHGEVPAAADSPYSIPEDGTLPGLLVSRFRLVTTAAATLSAVTVRSAPSMLSARLGLRPPFWTRIGELAEAVTTPDFAQMLAVAVTEATVQDGALRIPLVVHSDTLCRLDITWRISYVREVSGLPDGVPDVRQSFDVNGLALEATPAIQVALPPAAQVVGTEGRIRGAFGSSRVMLGPVGSVTEVDEVTVGRGRAQARPLTTAQDLSAEAVDLLLTPRAGGVSLTLQVVEDLDGRPWNAPLLPRPAEMRLDPPKTLAATWVSVPLGARFRFAAGRRYWLILQAVDGTAGWQVEPVPAPDTGSAAASTADYRPGLQWSGDGGLSWRIATAGAAQPPLRALFRLRAVPDAFEMPALLAVGTPARVEVVGARAEGMIPVQTSEAELSVRVPATEKALLWERFSLRQQVEVAAPVHVAAQAPGEVRVSGAAVRYDVPVPAAPPLPATGLCPATPPDVIPGTRPQNRGHCPCCGTERAVTHARAAVTGVGRPATVGTCAACGTAILRIGGAAEGITGPGGGRRDLAQTDLPRVRPATALEPWPVDDAQVSSVSGVGRVRERQLAAVGIVTVSQLLAASPGELAAALGVSKGLVATLLTAAGELRELGTRIRWVVRGEGGTPEARIAAVAGTNADGTPWRLPLGEAVARVMAGTWSFHVVRSGGARIPLIAAHGVHGPYLRAADDSEQPESLLALPDLPHPGPAPVSPPALPAPGRG